METKQISTDVLVDKSYCTIMLEVSFCLPGNKQKTIIYQCIVHRFPLLSVFKNVASWKHLFLSSARCWENACRHSARKMRFFFYSFIQSIVTIPFASLLTLTSFSPSLVDGGQLCVLLFKHHLIFRFSSLAWLMNSFTDSLIHSFILSLFSD